MQDNPLAVLSSLRRLAQILGILLIHSVSHAWRRFLWWLPWVSRRRPPATRPERFKQLLERLGGTFIKFGQVMALQPDLLPREYCDALFDLMDRVAPFDYRGVERIFVADLGRRPEEIFDHFDREPFGAASIGQVHRAILGGRPLAVKVQRPTARAVFGNDLRLMRLLLRGLRTLRITSLEWLSRPLAEFVDWTREELDYRTEARYMDQLAKNSRERASERVPEVVWDLTTGRILVADLLEGVTLLGYLRARERADATTLERVAGLGFVPARFAENILENFLGDVFRHGLFHADLHPANLLILADNVVGYVDFGISGAISRHARRHLMASILGLIRSDLDEVADHFLAISRVGPQADLDLFRRSLTGLSDRWYEGAPGNRKRTVSYSVMMLDMLQVCREHTVIPHGETLRYMRSVVTADGLIARVAPEVEVDEALERFCSELFHSEALRTTFSAHRVIESWVAGSRLLRDGVDRLDDLLARVERDATERQGERSAPARRPRTAVGIRAFASASLVAVSGLLLIQGPTAARFGLNLFSAELVLLAAGGFFLVGSVVGWLASTP